MTSEEIIAILESYKSFEDNRTEELSYHGYDNSKASRKRKEALDEAIKALSVPKKGEWVYVGDGGGFLNVECWKEYNCSICGRRVRLGRRKDLLSEFPFCHCGADMRGGNE